MRAGADKQTTAGRDAAILHGAAALFASQGGNVNMNEVAQAAGVARATLYRYFPTREALLGELRRTAVGDIAAALTSARINDVAPEEGIARAVRALVDVGDGFLLLNDIGMTSGDSNVSSRNRCASSSTGGRCTG